MARGRNSSAEQIVAKLRQIESEIAQRKSIALACKEAEILPQSFFRLQIPMQSGQPFRSEVGRDSDLKPATVPI